MVQLQMDDDDMNELVDENFVESIWLYYVGAVGGE